MQIATLSGQIASDIRLEGNRCHFSLRTETGMFFIKTCGLEQMRTVRHMVMGDEVCVVGCLHSYRYKKCGRHHVYIEAMALVPAEQSDGFKRLAEILSVQTLSLARNGR